jgi:glycosyltransferase involved in cell wall biosynthesis
VDLQEIKFWGPNLKAKTVLFLGNLYFEPNEEALKIIHRDIYPKLKKANFKFLIVGDYPKKLKVKYQAKNFKFVGVVKDLNTVFKKSTLALAPITEGTGLRIKTLNYLAAGIPVITTSTSTAGFKYKNCLIIKDDFQKYPSLILELTKSKKELEELSKRGRRVMEKYFDWKIIAKDTKAAYRKILSHRPKDKTKYIKSIANFNIKEPVWLEEAKRKGRFLDRNYRPRGKFSYGVVKNGRVNIFR